MSLIWAFGEVCHFCIWGGDSRGRPDCSLSDLASQLCSLSSMDESSPLLVSLPGTYHCGWPFPCPCSCAGTGTGAWGLLPSLLQIFLNLIPEKGTCSRILLHPRTASENCLNASIGEWQAYRVRGNGNSHPLSSLDHRKSSFLPAATSPAFHWNHDGNKQ